MVTALGRSEQKPDFVIVAERHGSRREPRSTIVLTGKDPAVRGRRHSRRPAGDTPEVHGQTGIRSRKDYMPAIAGHARGERAKQIGVVGIASSGIPNFRGREYVCFRNAPTHHGHLGSLLLIAERIDQGQCPCSLVQCQQAIRE